MSNQYFRNSLFFVITCFWCIGFTGKLAAQITRDQLTSLLPSLSEVSAMVRLAPDKKPLKFGRTMPKGELLAPRTSLPVEEHIIEDEFALNVACLMPGLVGRITDTVKRVLYTDDKMYHLNIYVDIMDSSAMVEKFMGKHNVGSAIETLGTFAGGRMLGDYSWTLGGDSKGGLLTSRCGRLLIDIKVCHTQLARSQKYEVWFPPNALDALACSILLKAARNSAITEVKSKNWTMEVNGMPLQNVSAIEVVTRTFVSPLDFCKAAGISATWNADLSCVDINVSGKIRLLPGSIETITPTGSGKKLSLPPFMDGDNCMMDLDDLLMVLGAARSTSGDKILIKL